MDEPYQLMFDIWEGNPPIDVDIFKANGVTGGIVRLNSISGRLHMDDRFDQNWALAKQFPVQTIYFVYTPWNTGRENFEWLLAHLPSDFGRRRIMLDVEVKREGYSPFKYKDELLAFLLLLDLSGYKYAIYTGHWFLPVLSSWPTNVDYWWAAYSNILIASKTWAEYKANLAKLSFEAFTNKCPGTVRLWQSTGDGVRLEGFGGHAVDVNVFPGSLEEAIEWFNCDPKNIKEPEKEVSVANPIGLFTFKPGWTAVNSNYNFVAGQAQKPGTVDANEFIAPIEREAAEGKIPFMLWWDHIPYKYAEQQWGEANWPTIGADYIFQNFKNILADRTYQAVVVNVTKHLKADNKTPEDKAFVAFSARKFMERVGDWLKANRPNVPLILATNHPFMRDNAPNMTIWAHNYYSLAYELSPIKNSYPLPGVKPGYFGVRTECEWWRYHDRTDGTGLIIFRGANGYLPTVADMHRWLNYNSGSTQPEKPPVQNPDDLKALQEKMELLESQLGTISTDLELVKGILRKPLMD